MMFLGGSDSLRREMAEPYPLLRERVLNPATEGQVPFSGPAHSKKRVGE